jgi:protein kinase X
VLQGLKLDSCRLEDFEVGRVLGTGSFGRVSLARHKSSGLVCAIKALSKAHIVKNQQASRTLASSMTGSVISACLHPGLNVSHSHLDVPAVTTLAPSGIYLPRCDLQISHLRSERDILRSLDHPLLVRMHGCCQDEHCVYFVMEYVPGELVECRL